MTTSSPSVSRTAIEDSGCLVSLGYFADSAIIPPAAISTSVKPQASFAIVARTAPEDPGCLSDLNILTAIETPAASTSAERFTPARTLDISTEAWGQQELAAAEMALNAERSTRQTVVAPTRTLALA